MALLPRTLTAFQKDVSIVIPAYNEESAITTVVADLKTAMSQTDWRYEIIVVNDASKDQTAHNADTTGVTVISHPTNVGYGGALHTGIQASKFFWIATIDADCSYPAKELLKLLPHAQYHDMVVGARQGKNYWGTFLKHPARLAFLALAQFVVGARIPDVNSGLRLFRKSVVIEMLPRLCRGFSFSTTLTLSFLSSYRFVRFEPIDYLSRVGSSKVRYFRDTLRTLQLMLETIVYYNPVKAGIVLMLFPGALGVLAWLIALFSDGADWFFFGSLMFCFSLAFLGHRDGFVLDCADARLPDGQGLSFLNGCVVCGHVGSHVLYKSTVTTDKVGSSLNYIPTYNLALQHGEISQCDGCGFIFVSDQPSPDVYDKVYSEMEDAKYLEELSGYRASFRLLLKELKPYQSPGAQMLEVGCGAGTFLDEARQAGWNVHGIELSKWMVKQAEAALGPNIVKQGGYQTPTSPAVFDAVVAVHVVEHVPDPGDLLRTLNGRLKKDGVLCLVTPNIESLVAKLLKEKWWYIQIPHIYYFTPASLRRLLEKNNFHVERILSYPRFVTDSMVSNRIDFLPRMLRPIARFFLWPFLLRHWTMRLDIGDQMIVLAKRAS